MNRSLVLAIACLLFVLQVFGADKRQPVKIINRRNSSTSYSYYVPAHAQANSDGSYGCFGTADNINCSGSQHSSAYAVGASMTSYSVSGATLALLLPDSRVAVVNCSSKYSLKMDYINRRSCRFPLVDDIEAEFHGNHAKLLWRVSLDGRKVESETYNIVAVLEPPDSVGTQGGERVQSASVSVSANNPQSTSFDDVMTWFDESAPGPATEIREVVITARAYDGILDILRKLRDSDTSVKSGFSVLDSGYHPASFRLGASIPSKHSVQVFYWDDEVPTAESLVMHIRVTRRVYDNVTNVVGHLRVTTFTEP